MTRAAVSSLIGFAIVGMAVGFAVRELAPYDQRADGASMARSRTASGAPEAGRTGSEKKLPDLRFIDGASEGRSLSDFRGRVVLLNLWATWCIPCRKEMPALDRLQAALGGPDFEVVALSLDSGGVARVKLFYDEFKLNALRIYVDPNADALAQLGSVGIPLTVLVDREGRESWRVVGPREWDRPAEVERIRGHLARARK